LKDIDNSYELNKKTYRGGIEITDEIIAITSNRILSKGENELIIFNSTAKRFITTKKIENYSFTLSENNCSLKTIPKDKNSKLLFVACKKYIKGDKNGILLIKLQFNNIDIKIAYQKFYDTKNFEVHCFCPLLENKNITNNDQIIETEYFLVGGFDHDKREGIIKLYKVIFYDEIENIEIEYIQDIIIEKKKGNNDSKCFKGFRGPINCIIQSSDGKILVTCKEGNVGLFSEPNFKKMREIEVKGILNHEKEIYDKVIDNDKF
jgi:hypothetical protein